MIKKIGLIKHVLMVFVVVVIFTGTTGCAKPGSYYVKKIDDFVDRGYPKAERISGALTSDIKHEVVDGTAVIENRAKHSSSRWWVDVKCDYWASCFMRCDGTRQQCRKLAEDANFTVNSISPF